jgi:hypothetical protein
MNYLHCALILAIAVVLYMYVLRPDLMEHAATSPGTLIQLASSSTEYPGYYQDYYLPHGYYYPTYLHNDWDVPIYPSPISWTYPRENPLMLGINDGASVPARNRQRGYSYSYGTKFVPYLMIVILLAYIVITTKK